MLKYTLASLALIVATAAALFMLAAWWNERDAEAGPRPVVAVRIDEAGARPLRIDVERDRLIELTITNASGKPVRATSQAPGVEQFVAGDVLAGHSAQSLASILMDVPQGTTRSSPVRFRERGTFELTVRAGDRSYTSEIVVR